MDIDEDKIDEAALALMYLTLHEHCRAWKQIDWEVTNSLSWIGNVLSQHWQFTEQELMEVFPPRKTV
ncbi:MAG: hypothetical protein HRT51_12985 [Colwellia sp.]|nr:hypothetical protein [Colwellia sp.]